MSSDNLTNFSQIFFNDFHASTFSRIFLLQRKSKNFEMFLFIWNCMIFTFHSQIYFNSVELCWPFEWKIQLSSCIRFFYLENPIALFPIGLPNVFHITMWLRWLWLGRIGEYSPRPSKLGCNTTLRPSAVGWYLSLIHIWRCRRYSLCRSRWSPYH